MRRRLKALLFAAAIVSLPAHAAVILVDTLDDSVGNDNRCSLREAIINANHGGLVWSDCPAGDAGGTVIEFDPVALGPGGIIELASPLPAITGDLQIQGFGTTSPGAIVLDAQAAWRVLDINGGISVSLKDLQLTNGLTTTGSMPGGAIRIRGGAAVELTRVMLYGNATQGGSSHGGAIAVIDSGLTLISSFLADNRTSGSIAGGGAIYASASSVSISDTTIAENRAEGFAGGGLLLREGSAMTMVNSTVSNNLSGMGGGGIYIDRSQASLIHSTVAFNNAGVSTQGIHVLGDGDAPASLALFNTLVVQPAPSQVTCASNPPGSTIHSSGSLSTHAGCTGTATPVDDIGLRLLAYNGGRAPTHGLAPDSVAVDTGGDCVTDWSLIADQRGASRPGSGSAACDLGAFEVQDTDPVTDLKVTKSVTPGAAAIGDSVTFTLEAENLGPDIAFGVRVSEELPDGYDFGSATANLGRFDADAGLWEIDFLAPGGAALLTIEATVVDAEDHVNIASIAGGQFDPDPGNNGAQASIELVPLEDAVFSSRFEAEK